MGEVVSSTCFKELLGSVQKEREEKTDIFKKSFLICVQKERRNIHILVVKKNNCLSFCVFVFEEKKDGVT